MAAAARRHHPWDFLGLRPPRPPVTRHGATGSPTASPPRHHQAGPDADGRVVDAQRPALPWARRFVEAHRRFVEAQKRLAQADPSASRAALQPQRAPSSSTSRVDEHDERGPGPRRPLGGRHLGELISALADGDSRLESPNSSSLLASAGEDSGISFDVQQVTTKCKNKSIGHPSAKKFAGSDGFDAEDAAEETSQSAAVTNVREKHPPVAIPKMYDIASSVDAELPLRRGGPGWSRIGDRLGRASVGNERLVAGGGQGAKTNQRVLESSEAAVVKTDKGRGSVEHPVLGIAAKEGSPAAKASQLSTADVLERSEVAFVKTSASPVKADKGRGRLGDPRIADQLVSASVEKQVAGGGSAGAPRGSGGGGPGAGRASGRAGRSAGGGVEEAAGGASGPAGGGGAGPPGGGGGGGDGQGDPLPPFPQRLPFARCQRSIEEVRCGSDAVFYCTECALIWCPEHVCDCTGVLRDMPVPNISDQRVQIYQPCAFPEPPMVFVGASGAYTRLSYYFCHAHALFGTAAILPLEVVHIDMHRQWISRMVTQEAPVMVSRMAILPEPQFLFWEPKFAFGPA